MAKRGSLLIAPSILPADFGYMHEDLPCFSHDYLADFGRYETDTKKEVTHIMGTCREPLCRKS